MKKQRDPISIVALCLALFAVFTGSISTSWATQPSATLVIESLGEVLSNADLTAVESARTTSVMEVEGFSFVKMTIVFVGGGSATDIGIVCEESDNGNLFSKITETAGGGVTTQFNPIFTTSVSLNWTVVVDVSGFKKVRCIASATGATAGDIAFIVASKLRGL